MVQNLLVLTSLLGLCALSALTAISALPITSKPFARSPDHLAWDSLFGGEGDDSLEPSADGYGKPKKILPKSIFIAPTLQNTVTTCGPGYTTDHRGNCIQTIQINHNQLLLDQLNLLLANHQQQQQQNQQQQHQQQSNKPEDLYDYDYDYEAATSPATKEAHQKGPFQLTIPVQLETDPQALKHPSGPVSGSSLAAVDSTTAMPTKTTTERSTTTIMTTTSRTTPKIPPTTTTEKPFNVLGSFLESLLPPLSKDPFGTLAAKFSPITTTWKEEITTTPMISEALVETTTTMNAPMVGGQEEETTTFNPESGYTVPEWTVRTGSSSKDTWAPSEFATELAREQLVPVTATTTWGEATTSDAELLLSNAEGTTTYDDENVEAATTETRRDNEDDIVVHNNRAAVTSESLLPVSATTNTMMTTTVRDRTEATETVLPVQVMTTTRRPFPSFGSLFSTPAKGIFDWRSSNPIAIVTPVPNPFPFRRTSLGKGNGSLFKFTVPPPTTTTPRPTTTTTPQTTTMTSTEAPVPDWLLGVENESENSQKLRESLIESEQKEMNYENIDVNNRFIYHHLNGAAPSTGPQPRETTMLPIVVRGGEEDDALRLSADDEVEEFALSSSSSSSNSNDKTMTSTPTLAAFTQKLAAYFQPNEAIERRRVSSASLWSPSSSQIVTTTPAPPTTTTRATTTTTDQSPYYFGDFSSTTSRYENFLRSSSNRIRFPGPSVNRQPAPNKLIPNGQRTASAMTGARASANNGDKEKKPFWWFPSGWEVDTKQKEKPVLLRFWSKMPLIPDNVVSQRRSSTPNYSRNNRENSKSPSESLYREVAIQDVSRAFQERQLRGSEGEGANDGAATTTL